MLGVQPKSIPCLALWLGAAPFLLPADLTAQIPDTFENLEVLPEDISKPELVETMKGFAQGLGVRCEHCHAGPPGASLAELDFVSDEKAAKRTARLMLEMTRAINDSYLARLEEGEAEGLRVRCVTCHHGQSRPRTLAGELRKALEEGGIEGVVSKYEELREQYYGAAAYDFGERSLVTFAQELAGAEKMAEARAVLELNARHFPDSFTSHFLLGELHLLAGRRAAAAASYARAAEIDPANPAVRQRLQGLQSPPEEE